MTTYVMQSLVVVLLVVVITESVVLAYAARALLHRIDQVEHVLYGGGDPERGRSSEQEQPR